jgi:hypothetical protein
MNMAPYLRWPQALAAMEREMFGGDDRAAEAIDLALRKLWRAAECERIDMVMRRLLDEAADLLDAAGLPDLAARCGNHRDVDALIRELEARL